MLCYRCNKNIAVIYLNSFDGDKPMNKGLCLKCARELKIANIDQIMDKMGVSDEDIDNMSTEIAEAFSDDGGEGMSFLQNIFGNINPTDDTGKLSGNKHEKSYGSEKSTYTENQDKKEKRKHLETYCVNLSALAREEKLDAVIGRDTEITRVIQILNRRSKNNPCLIGEPGVGKTAIAEGLAQRIVEGRVPQKLLDKEVYLLDLTALVVKTQFRGQFEGRVKGLIDEIKYNKNIILVIDEVHNIVSAGDAEGSMSAGNILKPALSRGEVQVIGATTFKEYRKYIEKDAALERRFQPVIVNEPNIEQSTQILSGIKKYYEQYHQVTIPDDVIKAAVELSERYVTDRYLPDKAIDLIDEAGSGVNLTSTSIIEIENLKKRLSEIKEAKDDVMSGGYSSDETFKKIADLKSEECKVEERLNKLLFESPQARVTIDDLAKVIELWTGIPASKVTEQEFKKLSNLKSALKEKIVGQDQAIDSIVSAIKRNRAGVSPKRKPVSMIFAGSTGVGKTELVKRIAMQLFDSIDALIRLDMSEFMEKHSVSRIIGAPPGYVGYDEAGQVTEKVRRHPYSVILFDEIEKAHPDVLNILLQILDDGKITDAHGRVVNFENTIIVMTTNAGSENRGAKVGFYNDEKAVENEKTMKSLNQFLRPEFINRVDEIITFNRLTRENFLDICDIMLSELKETMLQKGVSVTFAPEVREYICENSFSEKYGARNLRRYIQKNIEDKIANILIENFETQPADILVGVKDGNIFAEIAKT